MMDYHTNIVKTPQTCHFKRFTNDHDLKPTNSLTYALHYVCMEKILSQWYTYRDTADKIIFKKGPCSKQITNNLVCKCFYEVFYVYVIYRVFSESQ